MGRPLGSVHRWSTTQERCSHSQLWWINSSSGLERLHKTIPHTTREYVNLYSAYIDGLQHVHYYSSLMLSCTPLLIIGLVAIATETRPCKMHHVAMFGVCAFFSKAGNKYHACMNIINHHMSSGSERPFEISGFCTLFAFPSNIDTCWWFFSHTTFNNHLLLLLLW